MLRDEEYVIYVPNINQGLFVIGIHKFGFKGTYCVDGIAGHYCSAHCYARDLEVILYVKLKVVFGHNQIKKS